MRTSRCELFPIAYRWRHILGRDYGSSSTEKKEKPTDPPSGVTKESKTHLYLRAQHKAQERFVRGLAHKARVAVGTKELDHLCLAPDRVEVRVKLLCEHFFAQGVHLG